MARSHWPRHLLLGIYLCSANEIHDSLLDEVSVPSCRSLHIAINSVAHYDRPRARLLESMRVAGVPMGQVHVFIGGMAPANISRPLTAVQGVDGTNYYAVPHNSIDFTAMIHIVENPDLFRDVRTWFYLHDTISVGTAFWVKMEPYCNGIPSCAVPLTRSEASCNIGLYDPQFLASHIASLTVKKNLNDEHVRFRQLNIIWEDDFFRRCDARHGLVRGVCAKAWRQDGLCPREIHAICPSITKRRKAVRVYGNTSAPRTVFHVSCIDLIKYAANTKGPRATMVLLP